MFTKEHYKAVDIRTRFCFVGTDTSCPRGAAVLAAVTLVVDTCGEADSRDGGLLVDVDISVDSDE